MENRVYIAEGAVVRGNVSMGEDVNIWYHATVRGDKASILIGAGTNIQDNAVVHVDTNHPVVIGEGVTIGHSAVIHGCTIGNNCLVGMGAIIMNGARIGNHCMVGAGALVLQNTEVPDNSLILGNPAKVKRELTEAEIEGIRKNALAYVEEAKEDLV